MQKTTKGAIDAAFIRELADVLNDTNLTEIEVEHDNLKIRVARQIPVQTVSYAAAPVAHAAPMASQAVYSASAPTPVQDLKSNPNALCSPMVGSAFRRPSPEAKAFVEVGSVVKEGEKVLLIEAMKTFNEINAHKSGTVTQILVDDKQPVEFGQPLLVIE